jgi:cysteine desulfurase/selenocysteine lyase
MKMRADFPILRSTARGKPLVYLDNGATTQKPQVVIDATNTYYAQQNSNIHRGVYELSQLATTLYEDARVRIQKFINAAESREVIYTRGTTDSINLVASSLGRSMLKRGDEVLISHMEHHSNIVPWQLICEQTGATLKVIPINDAGELIFEEFEKLLSSRTKIVSVVHVSNSLGTVNPVKKIIDLAHKQGAVVLIDGAQWVAHGPTDVQALDCDFYAFSGHKIFGPTGIGILYGKARLLDSMPPYQGGGDMISSVTFEKTTYNDLPYKFEAGTPNIAGGIVLGTAIDYIQGIGLEKIAAYEAELLAYAQPRLAEIPGVRIIGTAKHKASVMSFLTAGVHPHDLGVLLDLEGIAVRTGHHCCQPVMDRFHIPATARASLAGYNTREDVDRFIEAVKKVTASYSAPRKAPAAASTPSDKGKIPFPPAAAESPEAAGQELLDNFDLLGDWQTRYQYLIEMGGKLPPMPKELKSDVTRVHGCQSVVHLYSQRDPKNSAIFNFIADSDADIVRGLIAVLERLYAGQTVDKIARFDVETFFKEIGLDQHLSGGRRNGLSSMVSRIRAEAAKKV